MSKVGASTKRYFLSYSRADQEVALRLANDLRCAGIAMWVDQLDIRPSEHWDRAIERAVRDCQGLVVVLSPRSIESDNVADEISFAIEHGKSVLPIMIERCQLPLRITRMQVIDATRDYERAMRQCLETLAGDGQEALGHDPAFEKPSGISDPDVIAAAQARLIPILGPISAILVEKAAARASSIDALYQELGAKIESSVAREHFLKTAGIPPQTTRAPVGSASQNAPVAAAVPARDIERLTALLTRHIGPVAGVITRREASTSGSMDELKQKLASHIPDERERLDFLRQTDK